MKKLLAPLALLLFAAPLTKATDLYVKNATSRGKTISIAIAGHPVNRDSINATNIKYGTKKKFFSWGKLKGPLMFAYTDEMGQKKYNFFVVNKPFPIKGGDVKGVSISLSNKRYIDTRGKLRRLPVIRTTYPKRYWLAGKRRKHAFKVKIATVDPTTGETGDW